jgi:hypothetical protein
VLRGLECNFPKLNNFITDFFSSVIISAVYYVFWIYILPRLGKYRIRHELVALDGESNLTKANQFVKVPFADLETWDKEHYASGERKTSAVNPRNGSESDIQTVFEEKEVLVTVSVVNGSEETIADATEA